MQTERRRLEADKATENSAATSEAAGWIVHDGRKRPVDSDKMVAVKMRYGYENEPRTAGFWGNGAHDESNWWHDPSAPHPCDIVAYRIVGAPA